MTFLYVILAILVLEFLIFIHELGHFAAGKLLGFRVLGFSLGFGPAIFKKKMGETEYAFRAIPFGGACQFDGEDEEAENDPQRFNANPVWKRFIVILAGPFMNILTAFLIAFGLHIATPMPVPAVDPETGNNIAYISNVVVSSAADRAGIKSGDVLVAINSEKPAPAEDESILDAFVKAIGAAGNDFSVTVLRDGSEQTLNVTDAYNIGYQKTVLGVNMGAVIDHYEHLNIGEAFVGSGEYLVNIVKATGEGIANMFKNGIKRGDVSGVVGTVSIMVDVAQESTLNVVYIAVILSLSLGIFNLIPFPALDGGRLLFLIIEAIIGRPLNRKVEAVVNGIGLVLLFGLMIVVTASDIMGLFGK